MTITMDITHINTIDEITRFLKSTDLFPVSAKKSRAETYQWMNHMLNALPYRRLKKKEKRKVKEFIVKITGYNPGHVKRLIAKHKRGKLYWKPWQKASFSGIYTNEDIELLHRADDVHRLSGPAIKKILRREYEKFGKSEYRKIANISVSHIYNLRNSPVYIKMGKFFTKTRPKGVKIGTRRKPRPDGRPGYLRVDTVHQGDKEKTKGLYWINITDEVTQFEFVFCAEFISEKYMKSVLGWLMRFCPFRIINFHSDNGSEYINKAVAAMLSKLHIKQTKSRSRKTNDNALAESKNGSVIRKHFGYMHIPATKKNAHILNTFCINFFNPYLNYHRPCGYSTAMTDRRGKEKKIYKTDDYDTPYEKFKSIPGSGRYLKDGITFEHLDRIAYDMSDTEFGEKMNEEKFKAFCRLEMDDTEYPGLR